MKKSLMAALIVTTFVTSAFAKDPAKINYLALRSFNVEFKAASNVTWSSAPDFVKATFTLDNQKMEAFYNADGEKIATSSSISLDELPLKAKRAFAKKYDSYNVKEAILFEGIEESAYFISAENETENVIVKVHDNGVVSVFKRSKK
jgi:hypothetical protein